MGRIVQHEDFSDKELSHFTGRICRLDFIADPDTPKWIVEEAEIYVKKNPKPTLKALRQYITASVQGSIGWDDPDQPDKMLHSALKTFYLLDWLEHLHGAGSRRKMEASIHDASKVRFNPNFGTG